MTSRTTADCPLSVPEAATDYGPSQIEARIDQTPEISEQMTLWSQAGSRVIRGNLLVIPVEDSLMYVELSPPGRVQSATGAQARHRLLREHHRHGAHADRRAPEGVRANHPPAVPAEADDRVTEAVVTNARTWQSLVEEASAL